MSSAVLFFLHFRQDAVRKEPWQATYFFSPTCASAIQHGTKKAILRKQCFFYNAVRYTKHDQTNTSAWCVVHGLSFLSSLCGGIKKSLHRWRRSFYAQTKLLLLHGERGCISRLGTVHRAYRQRVGPILHVLSSSSLAVHGRSSCCTFPTSAGRAMVPQPVTSTIYSGYFQRLRY